MSLVRVNATLMVFSWLEHNTHFCEFPRLENISNLSERHVELLFLNYKKQNSRQYSSDEPQECRVTFLIQSTRPGISWGLHVWKYISIFFFTHRHVFLYNIWWPDKKIEIVRSSWWRLSALSLSLPRGRSGLKIIRRGKPGKSLGASK